MAARSKARKRALELLFEADQRGVNVTALLTDRIAVPTTQAPLAEYTVELVEGVVSKWNEITELLSTYSHGWTVERMPAVDRAILRIGTYEVVYADDIPDGVAVSEAVELAKLMSTEESPTFVNGLLSRIAEVKPTLV